MASTKKTTETSSNEAGAETPSDETSTSAVTALTAEVAELRQGLSDALKLLKKQSAELDKAKKQAAGASETASAAYASTRGLDTAAIRQMVRERAEQDAPRQGLTGTPGKIQNVPEGCIARVIDLTLPKSEIARWRSKLDRLKFVRLEGLPREQMPFVPGMESVEVWIADESVQAELDAERRAKSDQRFRAPKRKVAPEIDLRLRELIAEMRDDG